MQTDASISPANYGGPLIDISGRVIGILAPLPADTAGMNLGTELYDSGIGFAVPLADMLRVLPRLKNGETLSPGVLGIGYSARDPFTGEARIATCRPGSPAAKAGLRAGDLIVAADGRAGDADRGTPACARATLYAGDTLTSHCRAGQPGDERGQTVQQSAPPSRIDVQVELIAVAAALAAADARHRAGAVGRAGCPSGAGARWRGSGPTVRRRGRASWPAIRSRR